MFKWNIIIVLLLTTSEFCISQDSDFNNKFIRVYSSEFCSTAPPISHETEFSNYRICYRNIFLRPDVLDEEDRKLFGAGTKEPFCKNVDTADFDLILHFIQDSGLLDINMNYLKPIDKNGIVEYIDGGCTYNYIVETQDSSYNFPMELGYEMKLPEVLKRFNHVFINLKGKYYQEY